MEEYEAEGCGLAYCEAEFEPDGAFVGGEGGEAEETGIGGYEL